MQGSEPRSPERATSDHKCGGISLAIPISSSKNSNVPSPYFSSILLSLIIHRVTVQESLNIHHFPEVSLISCMKLGVIKVYLHDIKLNKITYSKYNILIKYNKIYNKI